MQFNDGDEITGPKSYKRLNGVWLLSSGEGARVLTDGMVRIMLNINVPVVNTKTSRTTRETASLTKQKPFYVYKEA